jgi:ribonuclease R
VDLRALKKGVLTILSGDPSARVTQKDIARRLRIRSRDQFRALTGLLAALEEEGLVRRSSRGSYAYVVERPARGSARTGGRLRGVLAVGRRGGARVRVEGTGEEIVIGREFLRTALHGDLVEVVPFAGRMRRRREDDERREGEIVRVVRRGAETLVGTVQRSRHTLFLVPDNPRIGRDILIGPEDALGAGPGDKVVLRLLPWEDEHLNPEGVVERVLGESGDPRVEVDAVAFSFGLPPAFPEDVEREAAAFPVRPDGRDPGHREDFRGLLCVTIDPADAKDFDDAVSWIPRADGGGSLGVHIADVSHYVREGTALDREALARGTSVYLVNRVIPMLPERLSNDLCSLRPGEDRLTYSVVMELEPTGTVARYRIVPGVIRSARRFAYEEVQDVLTRGSGEHAEMLLSLMAMARVLLRRRRARGSIDFDTPEVRFMFGPDGLPTAITAKERLDAHRLIEECMLLANKTVARHVAAVRGPAQVRPFVFRVHDAPDIGKIRELAQFVRQFGHSLDPSGGVSARELQKLLDRVRGSEVENLINEVTLRAMAKAVYAEKNIGHFGLAFTHYTHFTSPIRRYPDLVVHRLLREYAVGTTPARLAELQAMLPDICRQSSDRERVAMEAERESVKVMQVEYMKRHLGDEFPGVITGVTPYGLFVEITSLLVQGMIPVRDLLDDYYLFDERQYLLRGRSRGKTYRLGDHVRVRVVKVDAGARTMDFELLEGGGTSHPRVRSI